MATARCTVVVHRRSEGRDFSLSDATDGSLISTLHFAWIVALTKIIRLSPLFQALRSSSKKTVLFCKRVCMNSDAFENNICQGPGFGANGHPLKFLENIEAVDDVPKNTVDVVQVRLRTICDEKLRAIGVGTVIGH